MTKAPVFFISHGAPSFALEAGELGAHLRSLGKILPGVTAILVVSPHWQTSGVRVMATVSPPTMHDFGGFPDALYTLQYPAPGSPVFAKEAARVLADAGFRVSLDEKRGLDHGAWVPLLHLLPNADVPVFQVSMPVNLNTSEALRLGRALAPLRERGVLILGSGSMTHNLYELRQPGTGEETYAREFSAWVRQAVLANAIDRLVDYRASAPHAERAHPTEEHFLPLLLALGANDGEATAQVIEDEITYGVLSMESYVWGMTDQTVSSRRKPPWCR